jgi:hypothetical protein
MLATVTGLLAQRPFQTLSPNPSPVTNILAQFAFMGVPLKRLAEGLQLNYKGLHRNPSSEAFQPALKTVKRSVEILHNFFHKPETVRVWLSTSHPDLDGHTALEMILANNPNVVLRILENAAAGVPV